MKIYFHGATGDVTGSACHVKMKHARVLVDGGLFQDAVVGNFRALRREQPDYREQVLPESVTARVSVEKASTLGWARYVGRSGHSIGMETFEASAALKELQKKFGFTPENITWLPRSRSVNGGERCDTPSLATVMKLYFLIWTG